MQHNQFALYSSMICATEKEKISTCYLPLKTHKNRNMQQVRKAVGCAMVKRQTDAIPRMETACGTRRPVDFAAE